MDDLTHRDHVLIVRAGEDGGYAIEVVCPGIVEGDCELWKPCPEDECRKTFFRSGPWHGVQHLMGEEETLVPAGSCFVQFLLTDWADVEEMFKDIFIRWTPDISEFSFEQREIESPVGVWPLNWQPGVWEWPDISLAEYGPKKERPAA